MNRKEAIASGEDITPVTREEYYLKGLAEGQGGGGLEYVIPEQTVTLTDAPAEITNTDLDDFAIGDYIVLKMTAAGENSTVCVGLSKTIIEGDIFFQAPSVIRNAIEIIVLKQNGIWLFVVANPSGEDVMAGTYTISAIRGF